MMSVVYIMLFYHEGQLPQKMVGIIYFFPTRESTESKTAGLISNLPVVLIVSKWKIIVKLNFVLIFVSKGCKVLRVKEIMDC